MKNLLKLFFVLSLSGILFTNCEKTEDTPPELPPYETMAIDFESFKVAQPAKKSTGLNYGLSALNVGVWSAILSVTLAVPTAAFYASFNKEPEYMGDGVWQWTYEVDGFSSKHLARLTGEISADSIQWNMYIAREGINAHPEFKWFQGVSDLANQGGTWLLYHSFDYPDPLLKMNWTRENEQIKMVKYEYVREFTNAGTPDTGKGTYLIYGKQEPPYDAYFTSHTYSAEHSTFHDIFIEWSTTEYYGHVKSELMFKDSEWHCWDSFGGDKICD